MRIMVLKFNAAGGNTALMLRVHTGNAAAHGLEPEAAGTHGPAVPMPATTKFSAQPTLVLLKPSYSYNQTVRI